MRKTIFMNQILFLKEYKKHKWKYFLVFTACLIIIVSILIYNSYLHAENNHTLRIIESNYSIIRLYSTDNNDDISFTLSNGKKTTIIGKIIIDKINLNYDILEDSDDDFLEISICKFYGPNPNLVGNMCLVGHNYDDGRFFSNLFKLQIGDCIKIINNLRF